MHREPRVLEAEVPSGKMFRLPCKDYFKGTCTKSFCENGILQNACSTSQKVDADLGKSALMHTARLMNGLVKGSKRMVTKVQWLCWTLHDNWVAYFQDMEPPKSTTILRKSSNILKPIRCVRFSKAVQRHANIRDQNPSLGIICPGDPHQRNPNAPKFEDRSQEETECQERCAREAAWRLAKHILIVKEKHSTSFFSPSENWCLPAPPNLKPEEREFVVDSGASMHMVSKKDLNSAELETVTTSRSATTVITANGEATVYVKELDFSWLWMSSRTRQQYYRSESFAMKTDTHTSGSTVKNHISLKTVFGYSVIRKTSYQSWFLVYQPSTPLGQEIDHPKSSSSSSTSPPMTSSTEIDYTDHPPAIVSSESEEWQVRGDPCSSEVSEELLTKPTKDPKPNKNEDHDLERRNPLYSDIPEWLQEFRENLVDHGVPERRDSHASSSHGLSLDPTPTRSVDLGNHSVETHFPKDRNCEICQRTKITRAPCRRRNGEAVPRADKFGDLITADHKVLSEGCESRNNHRCAVVVQDLATQWIQSYPCKTKTSQETQRSLEFGKACEDLSWNHCSSTPRRSETNGIGERAVRRVKEGTSAVLLQSGLDEKWWADSMECKTYLWNIHRSPIWWEDAPWKTFWATI